MKKTVVFVGSTAFSGSTVTTLMLGNDCQGLTCGEALNYIKPTKTFHRHLTCGCGDTNCDFWRHVKSNNSREAYLSMFSFDPKLLFIVDSSKDPFWLAQQTRFLESKGISVKHLLIYKSPSELAESYFKRGQFDGWERAWVNYHRLYFTLIKNWKAISYRSCSTNSEALQQMCNYLEIPYFPEKKMYWKKQHHIIGGNHSAKIHLYDQNSDGFSKAKSKIEIDNILESSQVSNNYQEIYYKEITNSKVIEAVNESLKKSSYISEILTTLNNHDLSSNAPYAEISKNILMNKLSVGLRKIKKTSKYIIGLTR